MYNKYIRHGIIYSDQIQQRLRESMIRGAPCPRCNARICSYAERPDINGEHIECWSCRLKVVLEPPVSYENMMGAIAHDNRAGFQAYFVLLIMVAAMLASFALPIPGLAQGALLLGVVALGIAIAVRVTAKAARVYTTDGELRATVTPIHGGDLLPVSSDDSVRAARRARTRELVSRSHNGKLRAETVQAWLIYEAQADLDRTPEQLLGDLAIWTGYEHAEATRNDVRAGRTPLHQIDDLARHARSAFASAHTQHNNSRESSDLHAELHDEPATAISEELQLTALPRHLLRRTVISIAITGACAMLVGVFAAMYYGDGHPEHVAPTAALIVACGGVFALTASLVCIVMRRAYEWSASLGSRQTTMPDATPPLLAAVLVAGKPNVMGRGLLATILHLTRRGYFNTVPAASGKQNRIVDIALTMPKSRPHSGKLLAYEVAAMELADLMISRSPHNALAIGELHTVQSVKDEAMVRAARKYRREARRATSTFSPSHLFEDIRGVIAGTMIWPAYAFMRLADEAGEYGLQMVIAALLGTTVAAIPFFRTRWVRMSEQCEAAIAWRLFADYLAASSFDDEHPASLPLWAGYLEYAVAFGSANLTLRAGRGAYLNPMGPMAGSGDFAAA